jgi:hypothetical protein
MEKLDIIEFENDREINMADIKEIIIAFYKNIQYFPQEDRISLLRDFLNVTCINIKMVERFR